MWGMNSLEFVRVFSWQKKRDQYPYKDHRPCTMSEFMTHLGDKGNVNLFALSATT